MPMLPDVAENGPHVAAHNDERHAINELKGLTEAGRLSETDMDIRYVQGRACSTDGTRNLPEPSGVGLEFVITTVGGVVGLADIRHNGTSL